MKRILILSLILITAACTDQFRSTDQTNNRTGDFPEGRVQTCLGQGVYVWTHSRTTNSLSNPSSYTMKIYPTGNTLNGCTGVSNNGGTAGVAFHLKNSSTGPITVIWNNNKATLKVVQAGQTTHWTQYWPAGIPSTIDPTYPPPYDGITVSYKMYPDCTASQPYIFAHNLTWDVVGTYNVQQNYFNPAYNPPYGAYMNQVGIGATWGGYTCP